MIEYAFEALKPGANDDGYDGLEQNAVTSVGRFVRAFVLDPERAARRRIFRRVATPSPDSSFASSCDASRRTCSQALNASLVPSSR